MPRGQPKSGFRLTKKRQMAGWSSGIKPSIQHFTPEKVLEHVEPVVAETSEQIDARIKERFAVLNSMTKAAVSGKAPALVISGPPGLGKSYSVERILKAHDAAGDTTTFVKGYVRPTGLFRTLYNYRHKNNIIVFDDADSIFNDETSLNLLKAACDSSDVRTLSYMVETNLKDEDDIKIPKTFTFEGTIIFITNYDFDKLIEQGNKLAPHLQALISRTHYIDLMMKSRKDYVIRIQQVLAAGMLRNKGFSEDDEAAVMAFIEKNVMTLRELSLRMVLKVASLMDISPSNWENMAKATCCKHR